MAASRWIDIGAASDLGRQPVARVEVEGLVLALTFAEGRFTAVDARCAHKGGPLGDGTLEGGCVRLPVAQLEIPPGDRGRRARVRSRSASPVRELKEELTAGCSST